jgi:hypothetical protein
MRKQIKTEKDRTDRIREKQIEQKLVKTVRAVGGICPKLVSPGMDGMPDRMVLLPGGRIAFAELKAPGQRPRPLQVRRMAQLSRLGFRVYVIDGLEQINEVLQEIGGTNAV